MGVGAGVRPPVRQVQLADQCAHQSPEVRLHSRRLEHLRYQRGRRLGAVPELVRGLHQDRRDGAVGAALAQAVLRGELPGQLHQHRRFRRHAYHSVGADDVVPSGRTRVQVRRPQTRHHQGVPLPGDGIGHQPQLDADPDPGRQPGRCQRPVVDRQCVPGREQEVRAQPPVGVRQERQRPRLPQALRHVAQPAADQASREVQEHSDLGGAVHEAVGLLAGEEPTTHAQYGTDGNTTAGAARVGDPAVPRQEDLPGAVVPAEVHLGEVRPHRADRRWVHRAEPMGQASTACASGRIRKGRDAGSEGLGPGNPVGGQQLLDVRQLDDRDLPQYQARIPGAGLCGHQRRIREPAPRCCLPGGEHAQRDNGVGRQQHVFADVHSSRGGLRPVPGLRHHPAVGPELRR